VITDNRTFSRKLDPPWRSLAPWHNPFFWLFLPFLMVAVVVLEAASWCRSKRH
jgi:hypothetical protein